MLTESACPRLARLSEVTGPAICYSGYRSGQDPRRGRYPTREQVYEDLQLLLPFWRALRIYDAGPHADLVLSVIRQYKLPFQVMLGADIAAETSNPGCPWGADFSAQTLDANRRANDEQIARMVVLANEYDDIVFSLSIGNEASVDWTDHMVPVERLITLAQRVKSQSSQPVTFCENYVPWTGKLAPLVNVLDFISVHTYPVWEYQSIDNALAYTQANYRQVANHYAHKPVVITEAGWTTRANGRGIEPHNASTAFQTEYLLQLLEWSRQANVLTFLFEAFDEDWKGSDDPDEPEKHWGIYTIDRKPKPVVTALQSTMSRCA